jgi:hypothetical protein
MANDCWPLIEATDQPLVRPLMATDSGLPLIEAIEQPPRRPLTDHCWARSTLGRQLSERVSSRPMVCGSTLSGAQSCTGSATPALRQPSSAGRKFSTLSRPSERREIQRAPLL